MKLRMATAICAAFIFVGCSTNPERSDDTESNSAALESNTSESPVDESSQYKADMELLCSTPPPEVMNANPEIRQKSIADYWTANISSQGARDLLTALAAVVPDQKAKMMSFAAEDAGLESCPFGEALFEVQAPPLSEEEGNAPVEADVSSGEIGSGSRVQFGGVEVEKGLDAGIVRRMFRAKRNNFRFCYEKELVREPDSSGKLVLNMKVDGEGKTTDASVSDSTFPDASDINECIAVMGKKLAFPKPEGSDGVIIKMPLYFGGLSAP